MLVHSRRYAVLARVSPGYPPLEGRLATCYSPVRHFTHPLRDFLVRLACVRHAASVDSEPGSNSRLKLGWHHRHSYRALRAINLEFPCSVHRRAEEDFMSHPLPSERNMSLSLHSAPAENRRL